MKQTQHEERAVETSLIPANQSKRSEAIDLAYEKLLPAEKRIIKSYAKRLKLDIKKLGPIGAFEVLAALGMLLNDKVPD